VTVAKTTPTLLKKAGRAYTVLPTDTIKKIKTGDALAIWAYLQSKPQDWIIRKADIMTRLEMGRIRYQDAMRHLRDVGLVVAEAINGKGGKLSGRILICFDSPKYTEPSISAGPKGTDTEIDGFAKVAEPSHIQIKEDSTNKGFIQRGETPEKYHPSHKPFTESPDDPAWCGERMKETLKRLGGAKSE